jgi:Helix-turn-helix of DDE superfamily endonuclease
MDIESFRKVSGPVFRRLTGVPKQTFAEMLVVLEQSQAQFKARGGKPNRLNVTTRLLMMLEYWREYRTYLHIGHSYGVSESTAYRNIRWCEDTLIKSGQFTLPGKKALLKNDISYEIVLIDATETPIQRPQKNSGNTIQARKSGIH